MAERDGGGMFLNCSHCGLSIQMRFQSMQMEHCPRCLARARLLQPLLRSPLPLKALQGEGYTPSAPRRSRGPGPDSTRAERTRLASRMLVSHLREPIRVYGGARPGNARLRQNI